MNEINGTPADGRNDGIAPPDGFCGEFAPQEYEIPAQESDALSDPPTESGADGRENAEQPPPEKEAPPESDDEKKERLLALRKGRYPQKEAIVYNEEKPRAIDNLFDYAELFVITLVAVLLLMCFAFRHSIVDGRSMEQTLHDGDRLLISDLFYTPRRGDIVVFEDYTLPESVRKPLVKRVIAVAGDTVRIDAKRGYAEGRGFYPILNVYVNDELLTEDYVYCDADFFFYDGMEKITVPDGKIFVLGDHRNDSRDSRELGCIDEDAVLGRVLFRFYPFTDFGKVN